MDGAEYFVEANAMAHGQDEFDDQVAGLTTDAVTSVLIDTGDPEATSLAYVVGVGLRDLPLIGSLMAAGATPASRAGRQRFSTTVKVGSRLKDWKIMPTTVRR